MHEADDVFFEVWRLICIAAGQGMPGPRGGHGDLYAVLKIEVPKQLSDEERELFERLAEVSKFNPRTGSAR